MRPASPSYRMMAIAFALCWRKRLHLRAAVEEEEKEDSREKLETQRDRDRMGEKTGGYTKIKRD